MSGSSNNILIGVAWPYVNGEQHIGHIAGAYLPPDIFARYQRMVGRNVLMVSGSDTHGTPITVRADEEGITPEQVVERFHPRFIESYEKLGITFDLFTHTDTSTHWDTVHELFLNHLEKGIIYRDKQMQVYDPKADRFLPDRYVEGKCPRCGFEGARGDQCDNCGATYDATELIDPKSKITGNENLEVRESEHFFFDLGKVNDPLLEWTKTGKDHWRPHVINWTRGTLEEHELRGRSITRDMSWGITIPVPGYESKRIYVWYDAVIGYLAASREWAGLTGEPEAWKDWWSSDTAPDARSYYFIGKDNIPFHSIIWPGMLWSLGGYNLPYDVPANEYLNIKGMKFSKSKGRVIGINDVLDRYQPDAWRYVLTAMAPETGDVDFTWDDFVDRVNSELVANWGNLVNRVTSFAFKRFEGAVPQPGALDDVDSKLLDDIRKGFDTVGQHYEQVKMRAAVQELNRLSQLVNQHVTDKAPFKLIKVDQAAAATVVWVELQAIAWLNTMWAPILSWSSQTVYRVLGYEGEFFGRQYTEDISDERGKHLVLRYDGSKAVGRWEALDLPAGQVLGEPQPLFAKLDKEAVLAREVPAEA